MKIPNSKIRKDRDLDSISLKMFTLIGSKDMHMNTIKYVKGCK